MAYFFRARHTYRDITVVQSVYSAGPGILALRVNINRSRSVRIKLEFGGSERERTARVLTHFSATSRTSFSHFRGQGVAMKLMGRRRKSRDPSEQRTRNSRLAYNRFFFSFFFPEHRVYVCTASVIIYVCVQMCVYTHLWSLIRGSDLAAELEIIPHRSPEDRRLR